MVHIANDGQVLQSAPWSITGVFSGIFDMIYLFFRTLISPGATSQDIRPGRGRSSGSGAGSSGSGSGSNFRPGGWGPNRRIGRIVHHSNIPMPGGCAGGMCG